ncbi:hypothetical protein J6590_002386 [Homalodisca vitripennis]|nr:hypothetical protein J6590_002386 [Homalodisca vitripennis]
MRKPLIALNPKRTSLLMSKFGVDRRDNGHYLTGCSLHSLLRCLVGENRVVLHHHVGSQVTLLLGPVRAVGTRELREHVAFIPQVSRQVGVSPVRLAAGHTMEDSRPGGRAWNEIEDHLLKLMY